MREHFGIILLDDKELIARIYAVEKNEWRLMQYFCHDLLSEQPKDQLTSLHITESILDIFSTALGQSVSTWKITARGIPAELLRQTAEAIDIEIETINKLREQELLCKGMFTELW